jgi:glutathione synthase/RimK-type ligase-like ATP-grasp enzyme
LQAEQTQIRKSIENVALSGVNAIIEYCNKKFRKPKDLPDFQVLVGVDIILDLEKKPKIIEINDMHSGCNYELMKLE